MDTFYKLPLYLSIDKNRMPLSEVFLTGLYVGGFGFLGGLIALCYKSKCKKISCCGIVIDRDVEGEERIDQIEIEKREPTVISDKQDIER
jgi:hypothetical protein